MELLPGDEATDSQVVQRSYSSPLFPDRDTEVPSHSTKMEASTGP